jgi:acyl-CoA dehydrogenase
MLVSRATQPRTRGSLLSEKQGIQRMTSESMVELYQAKLMALHTEYPIENGREFRTEVAMCKVYVARSLGRIVDRAVQVHGALGYSHDSPLAGRSTQSRRARSADGADEVNFTTIAESTVAQRTSSQGLFLEGPLPLSSHDIIELALLDESELSLGTSDLRLLESLLGYTCSGS